MCVYRHVSFKKHELPNTRKRITANRNHSKQEHVTKYSKTEQFYTALLVGHPLGEVGVNLSQVIKILIGMKVINTYRQVKLNWKT